jgi:hypothetical protein
MRLSSLRVAAVVAAVWFSASGVAHSQVPTKEAGLGVFPFLNGNMDGQINTVVNDAVTRGFDIIYCSAFRTTGLLTGQLWITDVTGSWNTALGAVRPGGAGIDLRALITAAHARNIQVVAVLKCFETDAPPSNTAHKAYLLDVVRYLVNSYDATGAPYYDLDGLALDYVRWVSGSATNPAEVTNFCRDVKAICGSLSLHAYLVAGRFDFDGPTYDANFNSYTAVLNANANGYGQHWEQMARHVDVLMPMAYTADGSIYSTAARHQAYVAKTAEYARTACTRAGVVRRVAPVVKTYTSTGETTTPTTIDASIRGALLQGDGFQLFRWATIANQPTWWAAVQPWAVPGQNRPLPVLSASNLGLTARLDLRNSRDTESAPGTLVARIDLGNDGTFETGWVAQTQVYDWLLARPGASGLIGLQVRDADGLVGSTHRSVRVTANVLTSLQPSLSAGAGGSVNLDLNVGPGGAGVSYAVIGGLSGAVPGTPLAPGFTVPVNFDGVSSALLALINTPVFVNAAATLDANGTARATLTMPPGLLTPVILRTFTWGAFGTSDGVPRFVTNAWSTTIVP